MWLLPHLATVSSAAVRVFYRASRGSGSIPRTGPALLVGNHPNSLLDPAFLAWAAQRPVRFLAKEPLFRHPRIGWLIRGSGSLPVYRMKDDPSKMSLNDETFRAVYDALAGGSAVAVFPEGISHSEPGLTPLKTGAARIALGAARVVGGAFPIIPVGLMLREKDVFRSDAHAAIGEPVAWDDVALRGPADHEAVRELTDRIERGMRAVTLNLARWEDEPVVRTAEAVWAATRDADPSPAARVARLSTTADALAVLRASGDPRWTVLARDVQDHAHKLDMLGIEPADIERDTGLTGAARWALRRLTLAGAAQLALAAVVSLVFWIPYRLTGVVANALEKNKDGISTYKVLGGTLLFSAWIGALTLLVWVGAGWQAGLSALVALPFIALAGLYATEGWQATLGTARRWMVVRRRDPRIAELRQRQRELSHRLDAALAAHLSE